MYVLTHVTYWHILRLDLPIANNKIIRYSNCRTDILLSSRLVNYKLDCFKPVRHMKKRLYTLILKISQIFWFCPNRINKNI
jgi:hypothetical protein